MAGLELDTFIQQTIDIYWEDIALFAYDSFCSHGRGVVFIDKFDFENDVSENEIQIGYAVYDYKAEKPDPDAAKLIREYDPEWEVIFQYMRPDGLVHTARLKTAPGARHPWRIWLFDKLAKEEDDV